MDKCEKYREMISCLLDGELSAGDETMLRAHMQSCGECRRVYEAYAAISDALSGDLIEPPEGLSSGVMFRIAAEEQAKSRSRRWRPGHLAAMAACIVVMLFAGSRLLPWGGHMTADSVSEESGFAGLMMEPESDASGYIYAPRVAPAEAPEEKNRIGGGSDKAPNQELSSGQEQGAQGSGSPEWESAAPVPPSGDGSSDDFAYATTGIPNSGEISLGSKASGLRPDSYSHVTVRTEERSLLDSGDPGLISSFTENIFVPGDEKQGATERAPDFSVLLSVQDREETVLIQVWLEGESLYWRSGTEGELYLSPAPASAFLELLPAE